MSVDKLVDSTQLDADLTSVANAIRTKGGTSASLAFPAEFVSAIDAIPAGGGSSVASGTVTPTARTASISFDPGLTTITGIVIVPTSETPLKSGGKTAIGFMSFPNMFFKSVGLASNSAGSSWLTPVSSDSNNGFSQSGTVITITSGGTGNLSFGSFEAISYTWFAW